MLKKLTTLISLLFLALIVGCQTQTQDHSIAFSRLTDDYWQLWTMKSDGTGARQVTKSLGDKRSPAWYNEGRELLYKTHGSELFCVKLNDGTEEKILGTLGPCDGVVPSPDGQSLLTVRMKTQESDSGNLWLTSMSGNTARALTNAIGLNTTPSWSPDGSQIAYINTHGFRTSELFVLDVDNNNPKRLTNNFEMEASPAFAPNSKTIAFASDATGDYEIWLIEADGTNKRQLTNSEGIDTQPCWSPDGEEIIFASNRTGQLQLWIMNSDGSCPTQLTSKSSCTDPAWRKGNIK